MTAGRVRLTTTVLADVEAAFSDCGSRGAEGTGLIACRPTYDGHGWTGDRFVFPDQVARVGDGGCSVTVTEVGKSQLVAALGLHERYLVRVHSHPGEAFHSRTDDRNPALTHGGALSVVIPYFGLGLRRGLDACAVYQLQAGTWRPLPPGPGRDHHLVVGDA